MTNIDPDRDEKLCQAATPGELHGVSLASARGGILWCMFLGYPMNYDQQIASFALERDAVFFSEARTLLPAYIEEVRRLRAELGKRKQVFNNAITGLDHDIKDLRSWQERAVEWLGYFLSLDRGRRFDGTDLTETETADVKQLIEEANGTKTV